MEYGERRYTDDGYTSSPAIHNPMGRPMMARSCAKGVKSQAKLSWVEPTVFIFHHMIFLLWSAMACKSRL